MKLQKMDGFIEKYFLSLKLFFCWERSALLYLGEEVVDAQKPVESFTMEG